MDTPFIGREALDAGLITRHDLRGRFVTVYPGVYVAAGTQLTPTDRARAAWLWSKRKGVLAGPSAAAMHGAKWLDPHAPAALLYWNCRPPNGIHTWADAVAADEVAVLAGMRVTTAARTAFDLARHIPGDPAIAAVDALLRATRTSVTDLHRLIDGHRGDKGVRRARAVLDLVDPGAESPRETWVRLLIVRAGLPRPDTQIPVYDEYGQLIARIDMGWEAAKTAVEYDGDHHWTSRTQMTRDIRRTDHLHALGWIVIRVTADDTPATILWRIESALASRAPSRSA